MIAEKRLQTTNMITAHKNVRILLSLMKQYNVRHLVISPGTRNIPVVKSVEDDPFFTCYSVVDERSAAYFAVGLSLELRSPVAITCTSGQATRNYIPGMTEAFYRKAPLLAITTDHNENFTDQLTMQSVRQMSIPSDAANVSVDIPTIKDKNDEYLATRRVNEALDALTRKGGGPAHVNLRIDHNWARGNDILETARRITRYLPCDMDWPKINNRKVLVVVGQHHPFSESETQSLETFAQAHDSAIYVNHISNYNGKTSIHGNFLLASGPLGYLRPDLVISIGGQLGDYALDVALKQAGVEHWRVREDGSFCDTYNSLSKLFECSELYFFVRLAKEASEKPSREYFDCWQKGIRQTRIPDDLPLSHALIAQRLSPLLPGGTNLHFGILSSLRSWELVSLDRTIKCYANVAGFGIDGSLSTFLGQSVASESLCVLVIGDLSFFYDMNAIGNRHVKSNVRIILVNNSGGCEFRMYRHTANQFGEAANRHIAAAGHFGESAGGWVKNNRFEYLAVTSKDDLDLALMHLLRPSRMPIVLEVHTKMEDESHALKAIMDANDRTSQAERMTRAIKSIVPRDLKEGIKRLTG